MKFGDHGPQVLQLQEALIAAGYHGVGVSDGQFGHSTDASVRYFQAVNQIAITGEVDAATAMALGVALGEHGGDGGAARGEGGGHHPVVALIDVRYSHGNLDCQFENSGIEATGYVTYHFEGPGVHTFQDTAHFPVGAGAEFAYEIPHDLPHGHYRVTVYANVTDANPHGDSQHTAEIEHTGADQH